MGWLDRRGHRRRRRHRRRHRPAGRLLPAAADGRGGGGDMTATAEAPPSSPADAPFRPSPWRYVVLGIIALLAVFWIWALFFASKESINGIGEDDWTDRAQAICVAADAERQDL